MNQFVKLTAVSAIALIALAAEANVRQGPYVIAAAGYTHLNPNGKTLLSGTGLSGAKLKKKAGSAEGMLAAGYEFQLPSAWVLGVEAFGTLSNAEAKETRRVSTLVNDVRSSKVKLAYTGGVSINPGIEVADAWTVYLKLAAVYGSFKITNLTDGVNGQSAYNGSSKTYGIWGFAPGFRVKYAMDACWAVTLDGTYAMYQSKTSKDFDPQQGADYRVKIAPRVWSVLAGVSYKF